MEIKRAAAAMLLAAVLCGCGTKNEIHVNTEDSTRMPSQEDAVVLPTEPEPAQQEEAPEQEKTVVIETSGGPLKGYVICLDPGHGVTSKSGTEQMSPNSDEQKDAYAGGGSSSRQTEEELNLAVAKMVRKLLEDRGAEVVMTRTKHRSDIGLIARAKVANDAGADLCIRIHADDSDSGSSAHGISTLIPSGDTLGTPEIEKPSRKAAEAIQKAMVKETGAYDRGLVERSDLTGFNWSEVPSVLVEMGFLSNPEEDKLLSTEEYRQKIAKGIADGAERWLTASE